MLRVVCFVNPEDYWNIHSLQEKGTKIDHYGYKFEVVGGSETSGGSNKVAIVVFELLTARMAVGMYLPDKFADTEEFKLSFISQDSPTNEVSVECKLSDEVKRATYDGQSLEQLEYIGFSLEHFYHEKGAIFYLYDLKGVGGVQEGVQK